MKSFPRIVRRTHLYLTLLCLPWFLMYAVTALAFSHATWFSSTDDLYNLSSPHWSVAGNWPVSVQVPAEGDVPREVGAELLKTAGLQTRVFSVGRSGPQQVAVYIADMWQTRRLILDLKSQELTLYRRGFDGRIFLAGLHSRSGYRHASLASDLWAVMVDLVSFGILVWIASGMYIWWSQRRMRKIGLVALILGVASFLVFIFTL